MVVFLWWCGCIFVVVWLGFCVFVIVLVAVVFLWWFGCVLVFFCDCVGCGCAFVFL